MLAFGLLAAACGSDDTEAEPSESDVDQSDETTSETVDDTETTDAEEQASEDVDTDTSGRGLIDCVSNVADEVPAFYRTYFRCTDISVDGDVVVIAGSNLPPHFSYYYGEGNALFEAFDYSRGDEYRPNPNVIAENGLILRIPLDPVEAGLTVDGDTVNLATGDDTDYPMGTAGVALDGVALFNPLAAPGDDIEDEKYTFDSHEGHPQQQGAYHYHAVAVGPLTLLQSLGFTTSDIPGVAEIELYGVMCDGTVVMGANELDGTASESELDAQAGHIHDIIDADGTMLLENRYHIHMASTIGAEPRGLTPEAQYYSTCDV